MEQDYNIQSDIEINQYQLENECITMSATYYRYADLAREAKSEVSYCIDNLKIVMHNIFSSIVNVVSAAFGGLSESFTNVGLLGAVVNMTAKLAEFSNKIAIIVIDINIKPIYTIILQKNRRFSFLNLSNNNSMEV